MNAQHIRHEIVEFRHRIVVEIAGSIRRIRGLFRSRRRKKILFVCDNALMAEYLAEVWELLRGDGRLECYLLDFINPIEDTPEIRQQIHDNLPLPLFNYQRAYFAWWDLIIVADHSKPNLIDRRWGPALRILHGIVAGGLNLGAVYVFNKYAFNSRGKIRYSRMFVSSEANRDLAVRINPQFEEVISVVGSLRHDKALAFNAQREAIRREMGFRPDDKVVFVLSAWGPHALFNTIGDQFLAEARKLIGDFQFILNVHPNEYRKRPDGGRVWGEYLRTQAQYGFVIRERDDSWMHYMAACDIVVSDHTSLALNAALLDKPIVQVPINKSVIEEGAFSWRLNQITLKLLPDASNLREALVQAVQAYPFEQMRELAAEINSWPGESAYRARRELYELLKLPEIK